MTFVWNILIAIAFFGIGWFINDEFSIKIQEKHCNDGYWFRDSAEPGFDFGDWVCVNVEDMNYERAMKVCAHEVGHEIFAEECEENITKCINAIK